MPYNCYNDNITTKGTLWNAVTMKYHQQSSAIKFTSHHKVLLNDTLNEKFDCLDINGDFKLSCLVGLVKFSGSACYLKDVSSLQQVRVCFKYSSISRYEELLIDHLSDIPCTSTTEATHVVTRILYGADAIFVFDYALQKNERRQEIIAFMKNIVEKFPYLYLDANGDIKHNFEILNKDQLIKIKCKIYSDIQLENNPTTFQEAVSTYKVFLEQSSNSKNSLPKKVWLHPLQPLANLKRKEHCEYVEIISTNNINAIQSIIENLVTLQLNTLDLKMFETSLAFPLFQEELDRFANCLVQYKIKLLHDLGVLVPTVRYGKNKESDLLNLLHAYERSDYSISELTLWLENKKLEINMIGNFLSSLHDVPHAFLQSQLDDAIYDYNYDFIICFEFNVCGKHDEYLEQLHNFSQSGNHSNFGFHHLSPPKPWYKDRAIKAKILIQLKVFKKFFETNKSKCGTKYLLTHHVNDQQNEGVTIRLYENGLDEIFDIPGKPSKPELTKDFPDSMEIKWSHPNPEKITNFVVYYCENTNYGLWMKHVTINNNTSVTITNLQPDTGYYFKVCANCKIGSGEESEVSHFKTKNRYSNAVEEFKRFGKRIKAGNPSILQIPLSLAYKHTGKEQENDQYKQDLLTDKDKIIISKYEVGENRTFYYPGSEKVLMILGATGAGKRTLINSMINYLFGITFEDDFRLEMICENVGKSQAHSQTRCITSYTIHIMNGFKLTYPLTIVDTPGYGDLQHDKVITQQIKMFFSELGEHGIDHLDGVGFVVHSALARLTKTQEYIFDSILSLFGKDVEQNIYIMVTFADAQRPPVLDAISKAKINYKTYYTFNNSAIFADKIPENETLAKLFWKMGQTSFENFFRSFEKSKEVSLKCTTRVLDQKKQLDVTIYAIQRKIELDVAKIEELVTERKILLTHQAKIDANKDFKYKITMTKQRKVNVKSGTYVTNCVNCNFTCHSCCCIADDKQKFKCSAMENQSDEKTKCKVCPGRCSWVHHFNNGYIFELYEVTETRSSEELQKKYQKGLKGKKTVQEMVEKIRNDIVTIEEDVNKMLKTVQDCLRELNKIALRTNPLTEEDYLEMLIRSENEQKKTGYLGRIEFYRQALRHAQVLSVAQGSKALNSTLNALERLKNFKHDDS